jgi:anti-anti-sigma regulatory factor
MNVINYTMRDYAGIKIMDLAGSLNSNTIGGFEIAVKAIIDKESLILNMSNVVMITTAGITSLIDLSYFAKENGKRLVIMWPSEELLGLTDTLEAYSALLFADSPEEGITKIKHYVE